MCSREPSDVQRASLAPFLSTSSNHTIFHPRIRKTAIVFQQARFSTVLGQSFGRGPVVVTGAKCPCGVQQLIPASFRLPVRGVF